MIQRSLYSCQYYYAVSSFGLHADMYAHTEEQIMILATAIAWGLVYGHGFLGICKMMLYMVFIDFIMVGSIIASLCW